MIKSETHYDKKNMERKKKAQKKYMEILKMIKLEKPSTNKSAKQNRISIMENQR